MKLNKQQQDIASKHIRDFFIDRINEYDYCSYHEIEEDIAYNMEQEGIDVPDEEALGEYLDTIARQVTEVLTESL